MKSVLIAILLTISTVTMATDTQEDPYAYCSGLAQLAESAMIFRQKDMFMQEMMEIAREMNEKYNTNAPTLMVQAAYSFKSYPTEEEKNQAVEEFKDNIFIGCYKAFPVGNE